MFITDLPYLENISDNEKITGGLYLLGINSSASAEGDDTYALTTTDVVIRNKGKKIKATGTGTALAIGEDPYADVNAYYEGFDKVKVKSKYKEKDDYALMSMRVKAK